MRAVFLFLCALLQARAAEFWNGAVHYDPPFAMSSDPMLDTSGHTNGWEFTVAGLAAETNGEAKVQFRIETAAVFVDKEPLNGIRTIADLQAYSEDWIKGIGLTPYYSSALTKLDGREALIYTSRTNHVPSAKIPKGWSCSVCLFWDQNTIWQKTTLFEIMVNAEKHETLTLLTNSLRTLRLSPANWPR